jgi:23S rRNA (guanine745-N1)-methyltransferase
MVAAREAFLAAGHFAGLRDFVCGTAERAAGEAGGPAAATPGGAGTPEAGCIVEIGAGTGYYLAGVLDRLPGTAGLALDISKFAARRAARAHERMAAVVCDAWQALPVADGVAALVLDVFAPRNPAEFLRILQPGGKLVVVTPTARHLGELVAALGLLSVDVRKPERLERTLGSDFVLVGQAEHEERLTLSPADAAALAAMGPSARHLQRENLAERLAALGDAIPVTLSVTAATYTPRTPPGVPAATLP